MTHIDLPALPDFLWTAAEARAIKRYARDAILAERAVMAAEEAALRADAERYRYLRSGEQTWEFTRTVLNDAPLGIDAAIDAARAAGGAK